MEMYLTEKEILKISYLLPQTRKIYTHNKQKKMGELFIQKKDLFFTNFYSAIQRLKSGDIDEIKYSSSKEEIISITAIDDKYLLSYHTNNVEKEKELKALLSK